LSDPDGYPRGQAVAAGTTMWGGLNERRRGSQPSATVLADGEQPLVRGARGTYALLRGAALMSSDTVSILEGDTFVVSARRGDVLPSGGEPYGLFLQDTRFLSCWRLTVDASPPKVLSTDDVSYFSAQFFLVPPVESHYDQASFSIMRKRSVGYGFHEDIT